MRNWVKRVHFVGIGGGGMSREQGPHAQHGDATVANCRQTPPRYRAGGMHA
jgi:hypothetical protein